MTKSLEDLDIFRYTSLIQEYKDLGDEMVWDMKDGTPIGLKDMEDSHIKNTINMLKRKPLTNTRSAWLEIFESESLNRRFKKIDKLKKNINSNDMKSGI